MKIIDIRTRKEIAPRKPRCLLLFTKIKGIVKNYDQTEPAPRLEGRKHVSRMCVL